MGQCFNIDERLNSFGRKLFTSKSEGQGLMHQEVFLKTVIVPLKFLIGLARNGERIKKEKEKKETKENQQKRA